MPEYRVINAETVTTTRETVEVRLVVEDGEDPTLQARNPEEEWTSIAWLNLNGKLGLHCCTDEVKGLSTNQNGEIETF